MNLSSGTMLHNGSYRIVKPLGHGGFGITYLAEQVSLNNRKVCIKEFFPAEYYNRDIDGCNISLASQINAEVMGKFKSKFIKEAQTIATLYHPNIVHIFDVFEENNTAYYVMEYIEGSSLSDVVKSRGTLSEEKSVKYIKEVASALKYIHDKNINHLDVKPGNIMLRTQGDNAILIDFGLSKHYDDGGVQTSSTPVGISHGFAPIEQYKAGGVSTFSPTTDIYSLGATLYYLVTGNVPPHATDVGEDGLPLLPEHLSAGVRRAIKRSMYYWRKDRPQSIDEFLALLDDDKVATPLSEATVISVESRQEGESTIINVEPKAQPKNEHIPKKPKRGLWMLIFIFVLVAVVSFVLLGGGSSEGSKNADAQTVVQDSVVMSMPPSQDSVDRTASINTILSLKSVANETIKVGGGVAKIKYDITNPIDGESVKCNTDVDWLILEQSDGVISCTAEANTTHKDRTAVVTLTYCDQSISADICQYSTPPNNEIWYITTDSKKIDVYEDFFLSTVISHTYNDGKGVIKFDEDVAVNVLSSPFSECTNLETLILPDCLSGLPEYYLWGCENLKEFRCIDATEDGRCMIINGDLSAFASVGIETYDIPEGVTAIGCAFQHCQNLKSVTLPSTLGSIEDWWLLSSIYGRPFCNCKNLKEFKGKFASNDGRCLISNGTLYAFAPAGLTEYTIPNSVTTIGDGAFWLCDNLKDITIPYSVKRIDGAFWHCDKLEDVYCMSTIPPEAANGIFDNNINIYVPAESVDEYKKAEGWKEYADRIFPIEYIYHTLEASETLSHVAYKYETTAKKILELNPGLDPVRLLIGQKIRVK